MLCLRSIQIASVLGLPCLLIGASSAKSQSPKILRGHDEEVVGVAFGPQGKRIASASYDNTVRVWEISTGKTIHVLRGHVQDVVDVDFSPDGKRLASGGVGGTVRIWNTNTGKNELALQAQQQITCLSFSPDSKKVLANDIVWDLASGDRVFTIRQPRLALRGTAFGPEGKQIVSGGMDGSVQLWDAKTGKRLKSFENRHAGLVCVAFGPKGKRLATGSGDEKSVKLWDAATGEELMSRKTPGRVVDLAFSPKGDRIAASGHSESVKVWDIETGREAFALTSDEIDYGMISIAFSPDGQWIGSACFDGNIYLWGLTKEGK